MTGRFGSVAVAHNSSTQAAGIGQKETFPDSKKPRTWRGFWGTPVTNRRPRRHRHGGDGTKGRYILPLAEKLRRPEETLGTLAPEPSRR